MKSILAFCMALACTSGAYGQTAEPERPRETGPFGLWMGMSKEEVFDVCENVQPRGEHKYEWHTAKPPDGHPEFSPYVVRIHDSTGLCQIRAISEFFDADGFGVQVRVRFQKYISLVGARYGAAEIDDMLLPGSIFSDARHFMMGLERQERMLRATWKPDPTIHAGVSRVALGAYASRFDRAFFVLQYEFENFEACNKAIERDASKAF